MKYKYDFDISLDELLLIIKESLYKEDKDYEKVDAEPETIVEGMTKFVYGTLRSGQMVEYDGNIVVVGGCKSWSSFKSWRKYYSTWYP